MYKKKICIVGAGGVGKTSLVQRFLHGVYSPDSGMGAGVRIDKKIVDIDGDRLRLMLWDIECGAQLPIQARSYMKGVSAIIYVVDGTQIDTLGTAMAMKLEIESWLGNTVPGIVLFNKADLTRHWEINNIMISDVESSGILALLTSSKEGTGVNTAFNLISRVLLGKSTMVAA